MMEVRKRDVVYHLRLSLIQGDIIIGKSFLLDTEVEYNVHN